MIISGIVQFAILKSIEFTWKQNRLSTPTQAIVKTMSIVFTIAISCVDNLFES